ncbi:glutamate 5-kinase [Swingsia samuiensis]|uniref:Glutamate 5-kinase n=1 Tax=Swingsia samuiensis TaxID=1293412 RepID=A0A4Y6UIQ9_9PROT|nr:glutamate 5-kinase [Swingsia samuiensis]QDH16261.1 glutamate 5-kinase [Swingsia samuiensis]
MPPITPSFNTIRRVVIKIGSALLVDSEKATLRFDWLYSVCEDIAQLKKEGVEVVVVSSGAISLARQQLGLTAPRLRLDEKQALATIGQISLAQAWSQNLSKFGLTAGQLLLIPDDTENRERHLNARATLQTLLDLNCVPVINENDAIATTEIRFGDNDRLGARVAQMINADCLILLSDIDGLYTADPRTDPTATHIPIIEHMTDDILAMGGEPPAGYSSGGMRTKLIAAQIANRAGTAMIIANGQHLHPIKNLWNGGKNTWFLPQTTPSSARKRWIISSLNPKGTVFIDLGALHALHEGASLLPAGVTHIDGSFTRGDLVNICGPDKAILGRGLASYSSEESLKIIGHKSIEMEQILGYRGRDALIHRDDLTLDSPLIRQ